MTPFPTMLMLPTVGTIMADLIQAGIIPHPMLVALMAAADMTAGAVTVAGRTKLLLPDYGYGGGQFRRRAKPASNGTG
jgi:hypothetical protein